jgi:hypothetical protein
VKDHLIALVRVEMERWYAKQPPGKGPIGAYCIWWACFTCKVLRSAGYPAQLQAGTAYWPCMNREQDDGISNQFGYKYTPGIKNAMMFAQGRLPEIHAWAAMVPTQEIVDPTPAYWPSLAERLHVGWPGTAPRPYFWGKASDLPDGVTYLADAEAISLAYAFLTAVT